MEDFDKLKAQKDAIVERNLRDNIQKLLTNDEDWWLIERKPWSNEPDGNLFFTGNSWSNSALKAARFKTKGDAQNVIDNMIDGITSHNTVKTMRGYAFTTLHLWTSLPNVDGIMKLLEGK